MRRNSSLLRCKGPARCGPAYCYARPFHEYLGFSAGLDFESKMMVKDNAPDLLRRELSSRRWKPQLLAMSGVTDCYQPIERKLQLTRRCLAVAPIFQQWLEQNEPGKKEKILGRIRALRGGKLNDARFGSRMHGEGFFAQQIAQMFEVARRKAGLAEDGPELSTAHFRRPEGAQLALGL